MSIFCFTKLPYGAYTRKVNCSSVPVLQASYVLPCSLVTVCVYCELQLYLSHPFCIASTQPHSFSPSCNSLPGCPCNDIHWFWVPDDVLATLWLQQCVLQHARGRLCYPVVHHYVWCLHLHQSSPGGYLLHHQSQPGDVCRL